MNNRYDRKMRNLILVMGTTLNKLEDEMRRQDALTPRAYELLDRIREAKTETSKTLTKMGVEQ